MAEQVCKRTMTCTCPECAAALAGASSLVEELKQYSSKIDYGTKDEAGADENAVPAAPARPKPAAARKPTAAPPKPRERKPLGSRPKPPPSFSLDELPDPEHQQQQEEEQPAVAEQPPPPEPAAAPVPSEQAELAEDDYPPPPPRVPRSPPVGGSRAREERVAAPAIALAEELPAPGDGDSSSGGGGGGGSSQPTGGPPAPADLTSKDWKVRKPAYEALAACFARAGLTGDTSVFSEFGSYLPKMVGDSNASCLDAALDAVLAYADAAPNTKDTAAALAPDLISKGFSARGASPAKAEAALLKFMEVDTTEVMVAALLQGLNDRKPKVPPACVACITKAADAFGASTLPIKELRGQLKGLLEHRDTAVRTAAMALVVELVRWVGMAPLQAVVDELRSAQQADIAAATKDIVPGKAKPSVYLRKLRPKPKAGGGGGGGAAEAEEEEPAGPAFDARELIEAVDLMERLKKTEFSTKLAAPKWSDKVEALTMAMDLMGDVPKLTPGDYGDFVKSVRALTEHSHVGVASAALKLLGKVAEGLRGDFSQYSRGTFRAALGKLSDKRCNKPACDALEALYGSGAMSLESVLEDVMGLLEPKKVNPTLTRVSILGWVVSSVGKPKPAVDSQTLATLMGGAVGLLADSDPAVRNAASDAAAAIILAARHFLGGLGGPVWAIALDLKASNARAFKKISDSMGGEDAGAAPPAAAPAAPAAASGPPKRLARTASSAKNAAAATSPPAGDNDSVAAEPKPKAATSGMSRKASASSLRARMERKTGGGSAGPAAAPAKGKGKGAAAADTADDDDDAAAAPMTGEEAWAKLGEQGVPECDSLAQGMQSAKWQDRKTALESLAAALSVLSPEAASDCFAAAVVAVQEHTKNFKDANFNVVKGGIEVVTAAVAAAGDCRVSKPHLSAVMTTVLDKIADRKQHDAVCALLTAAAEAVGPVFVVRRVCKLAASFKAPPAHVDALTWLIQTSNEFGAGTMPVQLLCGFAVSELDNGNPKVRSAAIELLGALYHQLGPPFKALLPDDMKAATRSALDAQFDKVGFDAAAASKATRSVKGSGGGGAAAGSGSASLPRSDISTLLSKDCLKDMGKTEGKDAWKGRKAAIEEVIAACQRSGHYVDANKAAGEALTALRARLGDSQSNLKPLAATAIAELIGSLEQDATGRFVRAVGGPLIAGVGDNKKLMRDAALACLDKMVSASDGSTIAPTFEGLLAPLGTSLQSTPVGRAELLQWTNKHLPALKSCSEGSCLVSPLLACMQDKAGATRQVAEECLLVLVANGCATPGQVKHATRDFTAAVMLSLKGALVKIYAAGAGNSAPSDDADAADTASVASETQGAAAASSSAAARRGRKASGASNTSAAAATASAAASSTSSLSRSASAGAAMRQRSKSRPGIPRPGAKGSFNAGLSGAMPPDVSDAAAAAAAAEPDTMRRNGGKARRADADRRVRWVCVDETNQKDTLTELLRSQWVPLLSASAAAKLFPARTGSMECGVEGAAMLEGLLETMPEAYMDSLDLVLKWFTLRLCEKENVIAFAKLLEVLDKTLAAVKQQGGQLMEYEVDVLAPCVLDKCGQTKERFRVAMQAVLMLLSEVAPPDKYVPILLAAVANSKNSKSRMVCLEEVARLTGLYGLGPVGRKGLKELLRFAEAKEQALASGALDCIDAAYVALEYDMGKLLKNLGPVSDNVKSSIEDRIRARNKQRTVPATAAAASAAPTSDTGSTTSGHVPQSPGARRLKTVATAAAAGIGMGAKTASNRGLSASGRSRLSTSSARSRGSLGGGDDDMDYVRRASLGQLHLELDPSLCIDLPSGSGRASMAAAAMVDDPDNMDGPFKFNDSALEVPILSPVKTAKQHTATPPHPPATPDMAAAGAAAHQHIHHTRSASSSTGGTPDSGRLQRSGSALLRAKPMTETDLDRELLAMCGRLEALVAQPHPIDIASPAYATARDAIKSVYSMAAATAAADGGAAGGLCVSPVAHVVVERLVQCLETSFVCAPAQDERDVANALVPGSGAGGIDLQFLSTVLAALMAVVREMPAVFLTGHCVAPHLLRQLLSVVCPRLADERLSGASAGAQAAEASPAGGVAGAAGPYREVAVQVHRAMNKLAIAAAESCDATVALAAVLELVARVHANGMVEHHSQHKPSKVYVKLLLRLVNIEKKRPDAFSSLDLDLLLPPLAHFFARNPPAAAFGSAPSPVMDAVLDVWRSLAAAQSVSTVELAMRLARLPPDAFMVDDWVTRFSATTTLPAQLTAAQAQPAGGLYEQQGALLAAVWRAGHSPSAAAAAIKDLFRLQDAHPEVSLQKRSRYMSPAFKTYVQCQLAGLQVTSAASSVAAATGMHGTVAPVAMVSQPAAGAEKKSQSLQYLQERLRRVAASPQGSPGDKRPSTSIGMSMGMARDSSALPASGLQAPAARPAARDAAAQHDTLEKIRLKLSRGGLQLPSAAPAGSAATAEARGPLQPTPASVSNGVPGAGGGGGGRPATSCITAPGSIPGVGSMRSGGTVAALRERMEALKRTEAIKREQQAKNEG